MPNLSEPFHSDDPASGLVLLGDFLGFAESPTRRVPDEPDEMRMVIVGWSSLQGGLHDPVFAVPDAAACGWAVHNFRIQALATRSLCTSG